MAVNRFYLISFVMSKQL